MSGYPGWAELESCPVALNLACWYVTLAHTLACPALQYGSLRLIARTEWLWVTTPTLGRDSSDISKIRSDPATTPPITYTTLHPCHILPRSMTTIICTSETLIAGPSSCIGTRLIIQAHRPPLPNRRKRELLSATKTRNSFRLDLSILRLHFAVSGSLLTHMNVPSRSMVKDSAPETPA